MKISPLILEDKQAAAIAPRMFLRRLLNNLNGIYLARNEPEMCFRIQQYLRCVLNPAPRLQALRCASSPTGRATLRRRHPQP